MAKTHKKNGFFFGTLPLFPLMPICQPPIRKEEEEGESVLGDIAFFYENNENTFRTSTFCFCSGNNILPQTRLPLLLLAETNKRRNTTGPTRLFFENRFRRLFPTRIFLHSLFLTEITIRRQQAKTNFCGTTMVKPWSLTIAWHWSNSLPRFKSA